MYIIELFIKWLNKNKRGAGANPDGIYRETFKPDKDDAIDGKRNGRVVAFCKHFIIAAGHRKAAANLGVGKGAAQSNKAAGDPSAKKKQRRGGCICSV